MFHSDSTFGLWIFDWQEFIHFSMLSTILASARLHICLDIRTMHRSTKTVRSHIETYGIRVSQVTGSKVCGNLMYPLWLTHSLWWRSLADTLNLLSPFLLRIGFIQKRLTDGKFVHTDPKECSPQDKRPNRRCGQSGFYEVSSANELFEVISFSLTDLSAHFSNWY